MGFIRDWVQGRLQKEHALLVEKLDAQATILLADIEITHGLMPSEQTAYDLSFFRDFKVMIVELRQELANRQTKTLAMPEFENLLTLHKTFTDRQAAIAEGKRIFKERFGQ